MCWAMYFMSNKVIDQIVTKHSACIIDIYMANKMKVWCHKICFDQVRLRQKYYAPQVRPDWGLKPWPDHDSTFHVTEMSALSLGHQWHSCYSSTLFLCAHEHMYFMECALSQNVLLPLLMVHFVTRMYYYYHYYLDMLGNIHTAWDIAKSAPLILHCIV